MLHALLDLDGTITDPREGMVACMRFALTEVGCPIPGDDEIAGHIGPPLQETLKKILGPVHAASYPRAMSAFRELYKDDGLYRTRLYDGVASALDELRRRGASVLIATSKPTIFATRIVENFGLSSSFAAIHGSELDGTLANKSELIAHILDAHRLDRQSTLMVGDRAQDIVGARSNGIASIGALWGYGSREELTGAGATALCENPSMLCDVAFATMGSR